MRKIFLAAAFTAAAALSAQAQAGPVKRVLPQGKDGDDVYYQIVCVDKTEGSVIIRDKEKTVCAQTLGGQLVCNTSWTIQRAAEQACG